jgi:hypothetical protein
MSFGLYLGALLMHVAAHWILVSAIVLLALAILTGVKATRQKDRAARQVLPWPAAKPPHENRSLKRRERVRY